MMMPKIASQKNSNDWKRSAASARNGAIVASRIMPMKLPRNEPAVAMPIAWPASPRRARGWPSRTVAALAGVPGMLSSIALRLPP